jgi:predicted enzyme related to lactoylglutathione lyase
MGKRTSYEPGTFSWVDLAAPDLEAAKAFYGDVFGWDFEDNDAGGGVYALARLDGDAVCGLYQRIEGWGSPGWLSYVTVDDADASARLAEDLGGAVLQGPLDAHDVGRMALLADPHGAAFAIWQAGTRSGADRVNDPGCLCMNELITADPDGARPFYEKLFGWTVEPAGERVSFLMNDGRVNGAFFETSVHTPYWRACFTAESTEETLERVRRLGGEQGETFDTGHGDLVAARDPQGCIFSIFAGETDP